MFCMEEVTRAGKIWWMKAGRRSFDSLARGACRGAARGGAGALDCGECVPHSVPRSLAPQRGRRAAGVAPENATHLEGSLCQLVILEVFAAFGTARLQGAAPSVELCVREDRFERYAERKHKSPRERLPRRRPFSAPKNRKPGNAGRRAPGPLVRFPRRPIPCGRRRCRSHVPETTTIILRRKTIIP